MFVKFCDVVELLLDQRLPLSMVGLSLMLKEPLVFDGAQIDPSDTSTEILCRTAGL